MPIQLDLQSFMQELQRPGYAEQAIQQLGPTMVPIKDTTLRAKPTNNLTIDNVLPGRQRASIDLIQKIVAEAYRQGVDPNDALAQGWKESGFGTMDNPAVIASIGQWGQGQREVKWLNPMQYNAQDMAPIVQEQLPKQDMRNMSALAFNDQINMALWSQPEYKELMVHARKYDDPTAKARIKEIENNTKQRLYIQGGVNYLKKMMANNPDNPEKGFADYRGQGQKARYHGKHLMELREAVKKSKILQEIIDRHRIGA
jgi:uncharacterized short protein YbdD (DUF466 family)